MSRAEIYFLDPHTWISQLPEEALERLISHGEESVSDALSRLGPEKWRLALTDATLTLPKRIASQGSLRQAFEAPLTDLAILTLAVFWTRHRLCGHMRSSTGVFHCRIGGRNPRRDLEEAGLLASGLVLQPPAWVVPFSPDGRFLWDVWRFGDTE